MSNDFVEITGLWESEGKGGKYLSGAQGRARYFVFRNKNNDNPKAPSHRLVVAANKPREEDAAHPATDDNPF